MKRVFVTGGTGFIGRHTLPRLVDRGFDVHGLSREAQAPLPGVTWHPGDLGSPAAVEALMQRLQPSHLLHLAWDTSPGYYTAPQNVVWLRDSLTLCQAFIRAGGKRIVGAGSSAEYDLRGAGPLTEEVTPLQPNGLYGHCKNALQNVLASLGAQVGVEVAWGRVFFCYGPGEDMGRVVPKLAYDLLTGSQVPFQAGKGIRDYLHVRDVADAFAALTDSAFTGAVNIGSGDGLTLGDFVLRFAKALGRPDAVLLGALPTPLHEPKQVVASTTRLRQKVGWRPTIQLDDGLAETAAHWTQAFQTTALR